MADSTQDFTKKILIDVEVKSEQVKKDIPILTHAIEELTASQAALKKAGDSSSKTFVENAQQLRQLKAEVRDANKYIDNVSKAIYAETGSIQQNRAVLSLVTSDYVKLGQVEGQTAEETIKLAVDVNNLTDRLKDQEKAIGQTYRNVGNYTDSINKSKVATDNAKTSVQQFASGVGSLSQGMGFLPQKSTATFSAISNGFNQLSNEVKQFGFLRQSATTAAEAATTAEVALAVAVTAETQAQAAETAGLISKAEAQAASTAATEAATAATTAQATAAAADTTASIGMIGIALTAVAAAIAVVSAGLIEYLSQFASYSDGFSAGWERIKTTILSLSNEAGKSAAQATFNLKDLGREAIATQILTEEQDRQVSVLLLKMRDKATTAAEAEKIYHEALKITNDRYKNNIELSKSVYLNTVIAKTARYNLDKDELKSLTDLSTGYKNVLQSAKELIALDKLPKDFLEDISPAMQNIIAVQGAKDNADQRLKNRDDSKQMAADAKAAKQKEKDEQLRQKQEAAYIEAENLRKASIAKELKDIYESYGDQVVEADQAHNDELAKLSKFLAKKLITQKEFNSVSQQLTREHEGTIAKIIEDFQIKDAAALKKSTAEYRALVIQGIQNDTQKSIALLQDKSTKEIEQIEADTETKQETIIKLNAEIKKFKKEGDIKELAEAQERRKNELLLIHDNELKKVLIAKQTSEDIAKVNRNADRAKQSATDDAGVLTAKRGTNLFNDGGVQAAEIKATTDKYNWEISEAERAGKTTVLLEQQKIDALKAINDKYRNEKIEYAVQGEQLIQSTAFEIVSQGAQAENQKKMQALSDQKNAELSNLSLTQTQKALIEKKYKALEDAEKLRAFKANQKLQAANALINGAVAISKTIAEMGFLPSIPFVALTAATTAAQIAKILTAKPGFAQGGQFKSDGRGALLSGYSKRDDTNATLRSGEAVVVSEAMRAPWARNLVSDINVAFGGRSFASGSHSRAFATGGVFTDGGNANRFYAQPVYDGQGLANSLAYQLINNFPPIYTDVKDVINQIGIVATTRDRVVL